jgi:hypothetical protein
VLANDSRKARVLLTSDLEAEKNSVRLIASALAVCSGDSRENGAAAAGGRREGRGSFITWLVGHLETLEVTDGPSPFWAESPPYNPSLVRMTDSWAPLMIPSCKHEAH